MTKNEYLDQVFLKRHWWQGKPTMSVRAYLAEVGGEVRVKEGIGVQVAREVQAQGRFIGWRWLFKAWNSLMSAWKGIKQKRLLIETLETLSEPEEALEESLSEGSIEEVSEALEPEEATGVRLSPSPSFSDVVR